MKIKEKFKKLLKIFLVLFLMVLTILIINLILNKQIFVTKYKISNKKISPKFDNYKIVQLTDIHSIRSDEQKNKILNKVKKIDPDIIFVTGDLIDATYYSEQNIKYENGEIDFPDKLTFEFMSELTDITKVYFVYGNHEMMLLDNPEKNIFKVSLENAGVKILNNDISFITENEEKIQIVGLQDPATLYKDKKYAYLNTNYDKTKQILEDLFENTQPETDKVFTICLAHRPEYFELYNKYPIDLVFSGHTHGGIVKIPFIGGIYAHPQGWLPEFSSGMYENKNFQMIVSRGIGYSQLPIRIFNPPEIMEIILDS